MAPRRCCWVVRGIWAWTKSLRLASTLRDNVRIRYVHFFIHGWTLAREHGGRSVGRSDFVEERRDSCYRKRRHHSSFCLFRSRYNLFRLFSPKSKPILCYRRLTLSFERYCLGHSDFLPFTLPWQKSLPHPRYALASECCPGIPTSAFSG